MPEGPAFDLYDDRWHDCWVAATSITRLRKKQIDFDIPQRVQSLLEDYGPESEKPLTLRIYATLMKGFCVINNERARALFNDCERVVLMFARQPFAEGDNKIRLPAAKRPRMEAALTLDMDLSKLEASEAYDWTQAPLEEGALLRLGGGGLLQEAGALPGMGIGAAADTLGGMSFFDADMARNEQLSMAGQDSLGWLPKLDDGLGGPAAPGVSSAAEHMMPPEPAAAGLPPELSMSQLAIPGIASDAAQVPAGSAAATRQEVALLQQRRRVRELIKPGVVYGFDEEPMLAPEQYDDWQRGAAELTLPRTRASGHAEQMTSSDTFQGDHLGPRLRLLMDPPDLAFRAFSGQASPADPASAADATAADLPQVPDLLGAVPPEGMELAPPLLTEGGADGRGPLEGHLGPLDMPDFAEAGDRGGAEAQDEKTAQVGEIIRACLRGGSLSTATFHELVPPGPGGADRGTAASTFAAILALASAGELHAHQEEPYSPIVLSEGGAGAS